MPRNDTDHRAQRPRSTAATDIHDIRALTTTGAITLPRPQPTSSDHDGKSDA